METAIGLKFLDPAGKEHDLAILVNYLLEDRHTQKNPQFPKNGQVLECSCGKEHHILENHFVCRDFNGIYVGQFESKYGSGQYYFNFKDEKLHEAPQPEKY